LLFLVIEVELEKCHELGLGVPGGNSGSCLQY